MKPVIADTAGAKPVMWVILDKDGDLVGQSMTLMKGLDWEPLFRAAPLAPSVADAAGAKTFTAEQMLSYAKVYHQIRVERLERAKESE